MTAPAGPTGGLGQEVLAQEVLALVNNLEGVFQQSVLQGAEAVLAAQGVFV